MAQPSPIVACPNCGKQYRWKAELAGRKTVCSGCSQKMRLPRQPGEPVEAVGGLIKDQAHESDGSYQLAMDDDPRDPHLNPDASRAGGASGGQRISSASSRPSGGNCPACNSKLKPGAVICINCGYHVAEGKKITTAVAPDAEAPDTADAPAARPNANLGAYAKYAQRTALDTDALAQDTAEQVHRKEVVIPLILVGIALAGYLFNAFVLQRVFFNMMAEQDFRNAVASAATLGLTPPTAPAAYSLRQALFPLTANLITLIIQIPLFLLAMFVIVRLFGTAFGRIGTAMLQLLAVAMFANMCDATVASLLDIVTGGFGGLGGWIAMSMNFGVFMVLAIWIFELEPMEAFVMWLLIFLLPGILMILIGLTVLSMFL